MKFISEKTFFESLEAAGLRLEDDGCSLCFADNSAAAGFDFANLTIPDLSSGIYETMNRESASVERSMVKTAIDTFAALDMFPITLYASDNEWLDEDLETISTSNLVAPEEVQALSLIHQGGHGMEVIILDKSEAAGAVAIITPQFTALGTTCYAIGAGGRAVFRFSQDDEVSFNTTDPAIYAKARSFVKAIENHPFDIIWGEE